MKFFALLFVAAAAIAAPGATNQDQNQDLAPYVPCPGPIQDTPLCCGDVIDGFSFQCQSPPTPPASATDFTAVCAAILPLAKRPRCCSFRIGGLGVICVNPIGVFALEGEDDAPRG
ncbi:uncharacterized protein F5Z01DRAFT_168148 [Emericellopsis atlantica]|uniref:Hydrophobin n=1 Tax=Emericellopsis atlantica TaxID=2614577 RepID=A0A9P7ZIV1_9HYPO|nr:uncharacterized protein F5Z01DRAFT_168148 [Emericellopsis atlantica]KAG9252923.1 hypothetical protein F5Z01DRAFT_168148 [Emericellopsis atlantica]